MCRGPHGVLTLYSPQTTPRRPPVWCRQLSQALPCDMALEHKGCSYKPPSRRASLQGLYPYTLGEKLTEGWAFSSEALTVLLQVIKVKTGLLCAESAHSSS